MVIHNNKIRQREFQFTTEDFNFLRNITNERTGIVVTDDKFDMFYSRLSRRLRKLGMTTFKEYCDLIKSDNYGEEAIELINSITTNLTAFFRENHHFEYLRNRVIPDYFEDNNKHKQLNIWSAGCSTGEEPYSISIVINEYIQECHGLNVKILATDIDSNVLSRAASGIYSLDRVAGLPKERMRHWFQRGKGHREGFVRLKQEVRNIIDFGQLNLMQNWKLETLQDAIFCRNVIIYFDKSSKIKLINRFADNLCDGGYLFIGHSESLFKLTDRFDLIGQTIYRKIK